MPRLAVSRGLAVSAVGALAVSGLTSIGAPAVAAGEGVAFVSLYNQGNDASVRADGYDGGISLVAQRLDPAATITFEYNANPTAGDSAPGWTGIGSAAMTGDLGIFSWSPDASLVGREVAVRAVATGPGGTTYSTRRGVAVARDAWGTESLTVGRQFLGSSNFAYFQQPYASSGRTAARLAVRGLTSASDGTAQVGWWDPASQSLRGKTDAAVRPSEFKVSAGSYAFGGSYSADLDITAFAPTPGKVIAVAAELDTDDVHVTPLDAQAISAITVVTPNVAAGQSVKVTVAVSDASSRPIAGAEVRRLSNGSLVGYTNGDGRVIDTATSGSVGSYYVNTTDNDAFEGGTDLSDAPDPYSPGAALAFPSLRDGRVFDDQEYAAGDLSVRVDDSYQQPAPGTNVEYRVYRTGTTPPGTYKTAVANAQGRAPLQFAPSGLDGSYTVDFHLPAQSDRSFTFTAGDASFKVTPKTGKAAPGGQLGVTASLQIGNVPLSNRRVSAKYKRGPELVPGVSPDAGLLVGGKRVLSLTSGTDPLGLITYVVDDKQEKPQGAETGGRLSLSTVAAAGGGVGNTGNPGESVKATTSFGSKKGKAKVKLKGSSAGGKDTLTVKGPDSLRREKVTLFRVVGGKLKKVTSKRLGKKGDTTLTVPDTNGGRPTTYVVKLASSVRVKGSKSKPLTLD